YATVLMEGEFTMKFAMLMLVATALAAQTPAEQQKQPAPPRDGIPASHGDDTRGYNDTPQLPMQKWYIEIVPRTGGLITKEKFGDCQLHVEWMVPKDAPGYGQACGNSGVELMTRYEIQWH